MTTGSFGFSAGRFDVYEIPFSTPARLRHPDCKLRGIRAPAAIHSSNWTRAAGPVPYFPLSDSCALISKLLTLPFKCPNVQDSRHSPEDCGCGESFTFSLSLRTLEVINGMLQQLLLPALLLTSSHADTSATVLEARARSPVLVERDAQVLLSADFTCWKVVGSS